MMPTINIMCNVNNIVESIESLSLNDTKAKQRVVNNNLGKNITNHHTRLYNYIEKRLGPVKRCTFGHTRGSKTGVKHTGDMEVPIRDFELKGCMINDKDEVVITKGDGLQGFCRTCSKSRRHARITQEKSAKQNKSNEEIQTIYRNKYGTDTKKCSRCKQTKHLDHFSLSIGMECGFHNLCKICSYEYGSSVGERWLIYLPDGNFKYNKQGKDMHDDHIFPLSLGGSNEEINHQLLDSKTNIQKSNDLQFDAINEITPHLLSERFRHVLQQTDSVTELKKRLSEKVHEDILERSKLSDDVLREIYTAYCNTHNMRRNIERAIRKFRQYCQLRF